LLRRRFTKPKERFSIKKSVETATSGVKIVLMGKG
jgi:hypothetical protein